MPFTIDQLDGDVLVWSTGADGDDATYERDVTYTPSIYVAADGDDLRSLRGHLNRFTEVAATGVESWRRGFRHNPEPVLRVDVTDIEAVGDVAGDIRGWPASLVTATTGRSTRRCSFGQPRACCRRWGGTRRGFGSISAVSGCRRYPATTDRGTVQLTSSVLRRC